MESWDRYKTEQGYHQHDDYIREVWDQSRSLPVTTLFIDEFQDLNPLQYAVYKTWRNSDMIDRIYIAGDPNQSVYSFRGADPKYFVETAADSVERQSKSYRCPTTIVERANRILGNQGEMTMQARRTGGRVEEVRLPDATTVAECVRRLYDDYGELPAIVNYLCYG